MLFTIHFTMVNKKSVTAASRPVWQFHVTATGGEMRQLYANVGDSENAALACC